MLINIYMSKKRKKKEKLNKKLRKLLVKNSWFEFNLFNYLIILILNFFMNKN